MGIGRAIDMICSHRADGTVIPLRMRLRDEEGEYQTYTVKAYKDLSYKGNSYKVTQENVMATNTIHSYLCKIVVWGQEKCVNVYYDSFDGIWKISSGEIH